MGLLYRFNIGRQLTQLRGVTELVKMLVRDFTLSTAPSCQRWGVSLSLGVMRLGFDCQWGYGTFCRSEPILRRWLQHGRAVKEPELWDSAE